MNKLFTVTPTKEKIADPYAFLTLGSKQQI